MEAKCKQERNVARTEFVGIIGQSAYASDTTVAACHSAQMLCRGRLLLLAVLEL